MIQISPEIEQAICTHGESTYPHECCGYLIGRLQDEARRVEEARPAGNARDDSPANRYLITPEETRRTMLELQKSGQDILGFYHSHPDDFARPSQFDTDHAWPWYAYVIVSVRQGKAVEMRAWLLCEDRSAFDETSIDTPASAV